MTHPNDDLIDALFAQARETDHVPSDDLMARVLGDAGAVQDSWHHAPDVAPQPGLWARFLDAVGGWPSVSGLAAATIAGIWVGVVQPASVADVTATLVGDEVSFALFPTETVFDTGEFVDG